MMIYLDSYFFFNAVMDAVALSLAGLCASEKIRFRRLFPASLFGGAVALVPLILPLPFWAHLPFVFVSFAAMVLLAFGKKRLRRLTAVSLMAFVSSLFLGGAAEAVTYFVSSLGGAARIGVLVFLILVFLGFGAFSLWGRNLYRKMESSVISLSIRLEEKEAVFFGLVDSGCLLRDPEEGREVILLKSSFASELFSGGDLDSLREGSLPTSTKMVPVPIRTASGKTVLFAFAPNFVMLHLTGVGKKPKRLNGVLVALDFSDGGFGGCPCLVPLSVL